MGLSRSLFLVQTPQRASGHQPRSGHPERGCGKAGCLGAAVVTIGRRQVGAVRAGRDRVAAAENERVAVTLSSSVVSVPWRGRGQGRRRYCSSTVPLANGVLDASSS